MSSAIRFASASEVIKPPLPGIVGTPAFCMVFLAVDLSPIARIALGDGPIKVN